MGPPDLIGLVELDADAILAMSAAVPTTTDGGLGSEDGCATTTWLELQSNITKKTKSNINVSSDNRVLSGRNRKVFDKNPAFSGNSPKETSDDDLDSGRRNPFDYLGDISVAVKTRLPLPASLEEYGLSAGKRGGVPSVSRGVADAGVRVSATDLVVDRLLRVLCSARPLGLTPSL